MREDLDPDYFKKRLQGRLAEINATSEMKKSSEGPVELDQSRLGRLSRMDAMQQQEMARAASRLVEQEKQRIKAALSRMESGEYGYCVMCDDEIAEGRLRFDPSVLICISCAREVEKG